MLKYLGWFTVACFALALGCTVMMVSQYLGAPEQVRSFLIACVGAVCVFFGPRALEHLAKVAPAR
jgi:purine-cytosine permease-like protein